MFHKEIFFLKKPLTFRVGECTLLSYHNIRKNDEIEKDFCFIIFFAYIGAWLKSAKCKLDQDCMEYREGSHCVTGEF